MCEEKSTYLQTGRALWIPLNHTSRFTFHLLVPIPWVFRRLPQSQKRGKENFPSCAPPEVPLSETIPLPVAESHNQMAGVPPGRKPCG